VRNVRHIIHLVIVLAIVGGGLRALRTALVPATFGQYGAYVGASVDVIRSRSVKYVGVDRCKDCHLKEWKKWSRKEHATVACEVCHGPGAEHSVENADPRPLPPRSKSSGKMAEQAHDLCMSCHAEAPGRSTEFSQIRSKAHLAEFKITEESEDFEESMRCLTCHTGHDPIK